jgi:large subunit ribosomal protein L30
MPDSIQPKKVRITLVRSVIGYSITHKRTVKALGLNRINKSVELEDTPTLRGMLSKIMHLVVIEEQVKQ